MRQENYVKSNRRGRAELLCGLAFAVISNSSALITFLPSSSRKESPSSITRDLTRNDRYRTCLFMSAKIKKTGSSNNKNKEQMAAKRTFKASRKEQRSGEKNRSDSREGAGSKTKTKVSVALPSQKSSSPPWQVLSAKDQKKHSAAQKQRREIIGRGEEDPGLVSHKGLDVDLNNNRFLSDADRSLLAWKRFNPFDDVGGMTFVGSYLGKLRPPRLGVPEIAFLGRSNVGKSSLVNKLVSLASGGDEVATDKARVGKTPGATASVNLYALVGKRKTSAKRGTDQDMVLSSTVKPILGLVDLPGFGYAKLSKETKEAVEEAAERYLDNRKELGLAILLVDARRTPSDDDRAVLAALYDLGVPLCVVATKVDKLNKNQIEPALQSIQDGLGLPPGQPFTISSVTGEGTKELWKIIMDACEDKVADFLESAQSGTLQDAPEALSLENEYDAKYDQGFDWIHGVTYDEEIYEQEEFEDEEESELENTRRDHEEWQAEQKKRMKLKSLRKEVKSMERRGEI